MGNEETPEQDSDIELIEEKDNEILDHESDLENHEKISNKNSDIEVIETSEDDEVQSDENDVDEEIQSVGSEFNDEMTKKDVEDEENNKNQGPMTFEEFNQKNKNKRNSNLWREAIDCFKQSIASLHK